MNSPSNSPEYLDGDLVFADSTIQCPETIGGVFEIEIEPESPTNISIVNPVYTNPALNIVTQFSKSSETHVQTSGTNVVQTSETSVPDENESLPQDRTKKKITSTNKKIIDSNIKTIRTKNAKKRKTLTTKNTNPKRANIKENKRANIKETIHTNKLDSHKETFPCDQCEKSFSSKIGLCTHKRMHSYPDKPYRCIECCREFLTKSGLKQHNLLNNKHNGISNTIKLHLCELCKKAFKFKQTLRDHILSHTGEKPFACDLCDKQYTKKDYLRIHKRIHTGEKPYSCDLCKLAFHCRQSYVQHLVKKHTKPSTETQN